MKFFLSIAVPFPDSPINNKKASYGKYMYNYTLYKRISKRVVIVHYVSESMVDTVQLSVNTHIHAVMYRMILCVEVMMPIVHILYANKRWDKC